MDNFYSKEFKSFLIYDKNSNAVSAAITSLTKNSAGIYYVSTLEKTDQKVSARRLPPHNQVLVR